MAAYDPIELAEKAAAILFGTATRTIEDVTEELGHPEAEDDMDFLLAIDDRVFQCAQCGWWCEISEMAEDCDTDWICRECGGDDDDD